MSVNYAGVCITGLKVCDEGVKNIRNLGRSCALNSTNRWLTPTLEVLTFKFYIPPSKFISPALFTFVEIFFSPYISCHTFRYSQMYY